MNENENIRTYVLMLNDVLCLYYLTRIYYKKKKKVFLMHAVNVYDSMLWD